MIRTLFLSSVFLWLHLAINAQYIDSHNSVLPLKNGSEILFGKDIIINDQPDQSQLNVEVCSAFNGWLFAAYWYPAPFEINGKSGTKPIIIIMKSIDNGMNWSKIKEVDIVWPSVWVRAMDIIVTGQSVPDLKLILGCIFTNNTSPYMGGDGVVARYNANTGDFEEYIYLTPTGNALLDIALASDINYQATNSNPNSLAILIVKKDTEIYTDSVMILTSSDGGLTLNGHKSIAGYPWTSYRKFSWASICYGYSPTQNTGRYYAAWELYEEFGETHHIYTAHSEPNFDSPFTTPVCLDSLDPTMTNNCVNPIIACQVGDSDNDSSNITEVVVFEKYLPSENRYEIGGCYNLQSTTSNYFNTFTISENTNLLLQPDIAYNTDNASFYLTYYDSTASKLPLLSKEAMMQNPENWNIITQDYHDLFTLASPKPKVAYTFGKEDVMNVWSAKQSNGNMAALFDAPYSIYTSIDDLNDDNEINIEVYPNPCSKEVNFMFNNRLAERVQISLFNILGQEEQVIFTGMIPPGPQVITYNVENLPTGTYLYFYQSDSVFKTGKLLIIK